MKIKKSCDLFKKVAEVENNEYQEFHQAAINENNKTQRFHQVAMIEIKQNHEINTIWLQELNITLLDIRKGC